MRLISLAVSSLAAVAAALALSPTLAVSATQDSAPATAASTPESKPKTHTVAPVDLVLDFDRDGRIDSAKHIKVRLLPEAFSGGFEVVEVLKVGGRVKKGDVLLRLDSEDIDKAIEDATVETDHAIRRLKIAQAEQVMMKEDNATRLEQVAKARIKAEKELEIWEKYEGPDMIRGAELAMQSREFSMADQKQELGQLEEMYSGTHLAQETKDIVLDRARRGVTMGEEYMKLAKNDDIIARQYRQPQRDEQVRDALKWAKEDETHAQIGVTTAEDRRAMDIESAERSVADARERQAKLKADRSLLEVSAPADGIITNIDLNPKDNVGARQTICEVLDPNDLVVKFSAQPEDLRILAPAQGEAVRTVLLRLPDFPEIKLTGVITEMGEMISTGGGGGGEPNTIPVTVKVECASSPLVRLGLKCKVRADRTINGVLAVPNEAISWQGENAKCKVQSADGKIEERTIVVGPSNDKLTMVVDGLKAGDVVVIDDKK